MVVIVAVYCSGLVVIIVIYLESGDRQTCDGWFTISKLAKMKTHTKEVVTPAQKSQFKKSDRE